MMHIVVPMKIILGMYMHEQNGPVEIPPLYVFLSSIISLSILSMCLCLSIFYLLQVTSFTSGHCCTSSIRRKITTPSVKWVADKVVTILQTTTPNMGAKAMQTKPQDDWKCTIGYDTVWKGREKEMAQPYGSWEESFRQLFNWKAEVMRKMSNSVIEIDVELKDDMPYF
jgi:hypothetical protein